MMLEVCDLQENVFEHLFYSYYISELKLNKFIFFHLSTKSSSWLPKSASPVQITDCLLPRIFVK